MDYQINDPADPPLDDPHANYHPLADILELAIESRCKLDDLKESLLELIPNAKRSHHPSPAIRWINSRDAMRILNISAATLKRYRKLHIVRFLSFNGRCYYLLTDIESLHENQSVMKS